MRYVVTETSGATPTSEDRHQHENVPGLLAIFSNGRPRFSLFPLTYGALTLGRNELLARGMDDTRVSRQHLAVERVADGFLFRDLGSTNGSAVDGVALTGERIVNAPRVVRIGGTLLLPLLDLGPYASTITIEHGIVWSPGLAALRMHVGEHARLGRSVLFTGESGSGKEVAARAYHAATKYAHGPMIAINCAAIPRELAERLLFGARRGAFSGATHDAEGYVQAAHRGTLFLDEIAELDLAVQAKLLRVIEAREVIALGATSAQSVDIRICAATSQDLRSAVAEKRFREDLYYRIGRPEIRIPPLRERLEEIPWLIDIVLASVSANAQASAGLVETCLLRAWPGNVRELRAEIQSAAVVAATRGSTKVLPEHLDPQAGIAMRIDAETPVAAEPTADEILAALRLERGNVSRASSRLSISRSKIRRFIEREGVKLDAFRDED